MKHSLFYLFLIIICSGTYGQNKRLDQIKALEQELENTTDDTVKVRLYCDLAIKYRSFDPQKAEEKAILAYDAALISGDKYSISKAIVLFGNNRFYAGKYDEGLAFIDRAFEILDADTLQIQNNSDRVNLQLAKVFAAYGTGYDFKSDYANSIKYYLKATNIFEHIKAPEGLAVSYNNLGISYLYTDDLDKSEKYFKQSFDIYISLNDTNVAYQCKMNLGIIDYYKENYTQAIQTFIDCAEQMNKIGNIRSAGHCYTNIGEAYKSLNEFDSSLVYLKKGIEVDLQLDDPQGLGADYNIIGTLYQEKGDFELARDYFLKALDIAKQINRKVALRGAYGSLYNLEKLAGNNKQALDYHILYVAYHDSIQTESSTRELGKIEAESEYNKQIAIQQIENDKKLELEEGKRNKQSIILYFTLGIIGVILFFVYMLIKSLKQTKEQKKLVDLAKLEIEEKNKEMVDSIKYAKRIQLALLKEDDAEIKTLPNHFVLFQPKDIVSGDFYWTYHIDRYWYVAAVDCTGHGVPGALLTMLGTAYLNEICAGNRILTPAHILDELKQKITKELSQTGVQGESKDGMDMSLIRLDLDSNEVQWAGANNALYYVNDSGLQELKPDKQPIGYSDNPRPFTNHITPLKKGDSLYLFSDGYADQFGGEKGKKFKYSNFKKILLETDKAPSEEQRLKLLEVFTNWQGSLEQLDDVCVIGIRV